MELNAHRINSTAGKLFRKFLGAKQLLYSLTNANRGNAIRVEYLIENY